jgi:hypothetical protein
VLAMRSLNDAGLYDKIYVYRPRVIDLIFDERPEYESLSVVDVCRGR